MKNCGNRRRLKMSTLFFEETKSSKRRPPKGAPPHILLGDDANAGPIRVYSCAHTAWKALPPDITELAVRINTGRAMKQPVLDLPVGLWPDWYIAAERIYSSEKAAYDGIQSEKAKSND